MRYRRLGRLNTSAIDNYPPVNGNRLCTFLLSEIVNQPIRFRRFTLSYCVIARIATFSTPLILFWLIIDSVIHGSRSHPENTTSSPTGHLATWWLLLVGPFRRHGPDQINQCDGVLESLVIVRVTSFVAYVGIILLTVVGPFIAMWRRGVTSAGAACLVIALVTHWCHFRFGRIVAVRMMSTGLLMWLILMGSVSGGVSSVVIPNMLMVLVGTSIALDRRWVRVLSAFLIVVFFLWAYLQGQGRLVRWSPDSKPAVIAFQLLTTVLFINIPLQFAVSQRRRMMGLLEERTAAATLLSERLTSTLSSQQQLLWHVSHELRSPLTRLELALRREFRLREGQRDLVPARIEAELRALRQRIDQSLVLAQLADGDEHFNMTSAVDVTVLLDSVCIDASFEASDQHRSVSFEAHTEVSVTGSAFLLRSAFENVIRNAIRFSPPHSEVRVILQRPTKDLSRVIVLDEGPGVPPDYLERIFVPFVQVPRESPNAHLGSGLGLALAREAVRRHGGTIYASNRPGRGLRITIDLPLRTTTTAVVTGQDRTLSMEPSSHATDSSCD